MPARNTNMPSAFSIDPSIYTSWPSTTARQFAILPAKFTERALVESAAYMDFLGKRVQAGVDLAIGLSRPSSPAEYAQAWMMFWTQTMLDCQQTFIGHTVGLAPRVTANVQISTCPTEAAHPEESMMKRAA